MKTVKMKKIFAKTTALLTCFIAFNVWADAKEQLQQRLAQVENLSADYQQTVSSADGQNVQQGSGRLQLKRPNLFRMDSQTPQQTQIIADGTTLWFYDPFVEQVSASWVKEALNNTPFVLLTSNDPSQWQQYDVAQQADTFILTPKQANHAIKQFSIRIDQNGTLRNFSTIENDGQSNLYVLRNINNQPLAQSVFSFTVPQGAAFDDQRTK